MGSCIAMANKERSKEATGRLAAYADTLHVRRIDRGVAQKGGSACRWIKKDGGVSVGDVQLRQVGAECGVHSMLVLCMYVLRIRSTYAAGVCMCYVLDLLTQQVYVCVTY